MRRKTSTRTILNRNRRPSNLIRWLGELTVADREDSSTKRRQGAETRLKVSIIAAVVIGVMAAQAAVAGSSSAIVGRWQTVRTCQGLVVDLQKAGLHKVAPGVVGDYFPNQSPQDLAKKKNLCQGAKPQIHAHFFTSDRKFGSIDQHGQQVDAGTYQVSGSTLTITNPDFGGSFRFRIQGKTLMLTPLLTSALKQEALADPLNFHAADWMVAVAYSGHSWKRVACGKWC